MVVIIIIIIIIIIIVVVIIIIVVVFNILLLFLRVVVDVIFWAELLFLNYLNWKLAFGNGLMGRGGFLRDSRHPVPRVGLNEMLTLDVVVVFILQMTVV